MNCPHASTFNIEAAYDGCGDLAYSGIHVGRDLVRSATWCTDCGALKVGDAWVLPRTSAERLSVFTCDGEEWVVAASARDARDVYCETYRVSPAEDDDDGVEGCRRVKDWEELPPGHVLRVAEECPEMHTPEKDCPRGCDDNFILHHEKTCAEWARSGRGHLASRHW